MIAASAIGAQGLGLWNPCGRTLVVGPRFVPRQVHRINTVQRQFDNVVAGWLHGACPCEVTGLALRAAHPIPRCPDPRIRQISCKPTSRHGVVARLVRKRAFPKSIAAEWSPSTSASRSFRRFSPLVHLIVRSDGLERSFADSKTFLTKLVPYALWDECTVNLILSWNSGNRNRDSSAKKKHASDGRGQRGGRADPKDAGDF